MKGQWLLTLFAAHGWTQSLDQHYLTNEIDIKIHCNDARPSSAKASEAPVVDLGYTKHRAVIDENQPLFNFSNIRYGQAPIDKLRFQRPVAPESVEDPPIDDGSTPRICKQARPSWMPKAGEFIKDWVLWHDLTEWTKKPPKNTTIPEDDPGTTEDCLHLDVIVPKVVYEGSKKAPVLVWIHGGGYVFGHKAEEIYDPSGLFLAAGKEEEWADQGFVYVAINYRLGAYGWLGGADFELPNGSDKGGGTENNGLADQVLALKWVQDNIGKFGGDPKRVTVMGESAGASSILHHITSEGGKGPAPNFTQAVLFSPAFFPLPSRVQVNDLFHGFIKEVGAKNFSDLVDAPAEDIARANAIVGRDAPWGTFNWGPVVDETYVPGLPGVQLGKGEYHKGIKLVAGYNDNEGLLLAPPYVQDDGAFVEHIKELFHYLPDSSTDKLLEMYSLNNTQDRVRRHVKRIADAIGEGAVSCNVEYLKEAYGGDCWIFNFNFAPGIHGQDIPYTFYTEPPPAKNPLTIFHPRLARSLQQYIIDFVKLGTPNRDRGSLKVHPFWYRYKKIGNRIVLIDSEIDKRIELWRPPRCDWWQKGLFY